MFLSSYRNTRESLGELKKAMETLAYGSCAHSISRYYTLPLVLLFNNNRLWAQDFYRVIVDKGAARVNYCAIEIESE